MTGRQLVRLERAAAGVLLLTFDNPERFNTLDAITIEALLEAIATIRSDTSTRVVVITGEGKHFCAGANLRGHGVAPNGDGSHSQQDWYAVQEHVASLIRAIHDIPAPVIAAVNGAASGGGFGIALAADIRVAEPDTRFNAAFVRIGLSACDAGVSWLLPRVVGAGPAFELLLTGRFVGADEAHRLGLVTQVVPREDLVIMAVALATTIAANSPHGVRLTKRGMWSQLDIGSLGAGIEFESRSQMGVVLTADHQEAITAFREHRKPQFLDR